jgi:hypothetical protein
MELLCAPWKEELEDGGESFLMASDKTWTDCSKSTLTDAAQSILQDTILPSSRRTGAGPAERHTSRVLPPVRLSPVTVHVRMTW